MKKSLRNSAASLTLAILLMGSLTQAQASAGGQQSNYSRRARAVYPAARVDDVYTMRLKIRSAVSFLRSFWTSEFNRYGRQFSPPRVREDGRAQAHYDPNTNTISFNLGFFLQEVLDASHRNGTDGDMACIVIVGHEYGHAVQAQMGLLGSNKSSELQADRLAGVFAAAAERANLLDPGDIEEALNSLRRAGGSPSHGSSEERAEAFLSGYNGGSRFMFR